MSSTAGSVAKSDRTAEVAAAGRVLVGARAQGGGETISICQQSSKACGWAGRADHRGGRGTRLGRTGSGRGEMGRDRMGRGRARQDRQSGRISGGICM